jgi:thiopeptide-type bacteriocin biosynthesis protein
MDMGLLKQIKLKMESDPAICLNLHYGINSSLYNIPGQYRFMETIIENGKSHYQIGSVEHTEFLEQLIVLAKNRLMRIRDIYNALAKDIEYKEFEEFIGELIQTQFLVSELEPALTIENDLDRYRIILERLMKDGIPGVIKYVRVFSLIEHILNDFKELPIGVLPLEKMKQLTTLLQDCGIDASQDHLFHADLKQPISGDFFFTSQQVKEIEKGIAILGKLSTNYSLQEEEMERFKRLFIEKYESKEIPLSEVLDPEFGIGFPARVRIGDAAFNSLIEKVDSELQNQPAKVENCQSWLRKEIELLNNSITQYEIRINEEELKDFDDKVGDLPTNFSVLGSLLPDGKILLENVGGSHANSLLGRFAYLDETMSDVCKKLADAEKENNPEVIFAEVIFVPEGRTGNIARRPVFSQYEIPFLATSGVKAARQILVDDLLVSIQDNEIILRSKALDRRIIPRLSNAHNYFSSLVPAYKFLSFIQHEHKQGFGISLANYDDKKQFLPRISFKNIIIRRAYWFLHKNDINSIITSDNSISALRNFFLKWNVKRFVALSESDNELFIDCSNDSYLGLLLEEIKSRSSVKLVEWLYDCHDNKYDKDKQVIQQFILPLFQNNASPIRPFKKSETGNDIQRSFEPGSEWVYFKIYCGATFSNKILLTVVKPVIHSLFKERIIKDAFFIRYTDPHYHIRFRLHLASEDQNHFASVIKAVYNLLHPLINDRIVWKVQLDTYEREVERYGETNILATEAIFFHDSLLYLNCLQYEEFVEDEKMRFLAAMKNMDKWLTLFKMTLEQKADYCAQMCNSFSKEYDPNAKLHLDLKYRELQHLLPSFINSDAYELEFNERDKNLQNILMRNDNWTSYIHMSMNRWFITRQRLMEYMCYLFCRKYYLKILHNK